VREQDSKSNKSVPIAAYCCLLLTIVVAMIVDNIVITILSAIVSVCALLITINTIVINRKNKTKGKRID
jgi:hypothetical protein